MSKYNLTKRISLAFMGDQHANDYLVFRPLTFKDALGLQELSANVDTTDTEKTSNQINGAIGMVKSKFVSGKITNTETGEQLDVEANDFETELGADVIQVIMRELGGQKPEGFTTA